MHLSRKQASPCLGCKAYQESSKVHACVDKMRLTARHASNPLGTGLAPGVSSAAVVSPLCSDSGELMGTISVLTSQDESASVAVAASNMVRASAEISSFSPKFSTSSFCTQSELSRWDTYEVYNSASCRASFQQVTCATGTLDAFLLVVAGASTATRAAPFNAGVCSCRMRFPLRRVLYTGLPSGAVPSSPDSTSTLCAFEAVFNPPLEASCEACSW